MRNYDLITSNANGKYPLQRSKAKSNQNIDIRIGQAGFDRYFFFK
jgi:hypothetical protein